MDQEQQRLKFFLRGWTRKWFRTNGYEVFKRKTEAEKRYWSRDTSRIYGVK